MPWCKNTVKSDQVDPYFWGMFKMGLSKRAKNITVIHGVGRVGGKNHFSIRFGTLFLVNSPNRKDHQLAGNGERLVENAFSTQMFPRLGKLG